MKLSVVIVSYNECEYIDYAIKSCINQMCDFDYEIIIGDDGSDDGTLEIIRKYAEKYPDKITYFVMDRSNVHDIIPSIRVSNVLKRAFEIVRGEYVVCLSGDDYFIGNSFQKQVEVLEKQKEYCSCYTDYKKVWANGEELEFRMNNIHNRSIFWSKYYVHISCFMFKKDVFKHMPQRFVDDVGLIFAIIKTGQICHISEQTFAYRQRDKSIMHEADTMELSILELLLFQDIINARGYKTSTLSKFCKALIYCYRNRYKLNENKYNKYIYNSGKYENDILGMLQNFSKIKLGRKCTLISLIICSNFWYMFYKVIDKMLRIMRGKEV